jgi:adenylate cyclase
MRGFMKQFSKKLFISALFILLTLSVSTYSKMIDAIQDRDKLRGILNKAVSKEISEEILTHQQNLGGEEKVITLFFSDIRGFTHFSEHQQPLILTQLLNDYMSRMCKIIEETHGVVDKFVGDEIMALYGAPNPLDAHPVYAIEAAKMMMMHLEEWNEKCRKEDKPYFEIGIGIHTGVVCAGNVGSENRQNYTVIGSNVNLASRLCSQAKPMQVLISQETWEIPEVQERFLFRPLPPVTVKGFDQPIQVYELVLD